MPDTGFNQIYDLLQQCFLERISFIINTGFIFVLFKKLFITRYHRINYIGIPNKFKFSFITDRHYLLNTKVFPELDICLAKDIMCELIKKY